MNLDAAFNIDQPSTLVLVCGVIMPAPSLVHSRYACQWGMECIDGNVVLLFHWP